MSPILTVMEILMSWWASTTWNTPTEHGYFYLKMSTVAVDNGVSMFCILVMNIMMAPSP